MEKAIADANAAAVEFLLKKKVAHKFIDTPETRKLLCDAAKAGNKFVVQQLLKADLNLNGSLHCAAVGTDPKRMIAMLLNARADVDGLNEDGVTALYDLVTRQLAELKAKHGFEGEDPPEAPTPEYDKAIPELDKSLAKLLPLLLRKGANPNLAPEGAPTVVEVAEKHGLVKTAAALKKAAKRKR